MKKMLVIWIVIALMLVAASPALAGNGSGPGAGPGPSGKGKFFLARIITAIDPANLTLTMHVIAGSTLVKPFIEQELTVQTTADTRFLLCNPDGKATPKNLSKFSQIEPRWMSHQRGSIIIATSY